VCTKLTAGQGREVLSKLQADEALNGVQSAKEGLADMAILFDYLDCFGVTEKMSFDMSLARGLDYYTGIIYEAVTELSAPPLADAAAPAVVDKKDKKGKKAATVNEDGVDESAVGVGSIAAGGRYDNLVNMFAEAAGSKRERVPCVGVSIGVERVYAILEARRRAQEAKPRSKETDVYIMALGGGLLQERMKFAKKLWDAGIRVSYSVKAELTSGRVHVQGQAQGAGTVEPGRLGPGALCCDPCACRAREGHRAHQGAGRRARRGRRQRRGGLDGQGRRVPPRASVGVGL
jgi:histidyl-tRNA synthetase